MPNKLVPLDANTVFPSARALLYAGISCREPSENRVRVGRWAAYWTEGSSELTLYPGDEGPQEYTTVDELIAAIGGDQPAVLTPASLKRFGVEMVKGTTTGRYEVRGGKLVEG